MSYSYVPSKSRRSGWADILVFAGTAVFLHYLLGLAQQSTSHFQPDTPIRLSLEALPAYSFYSLIRAVIAYGLSLAFSLSVGYLAAKNRRAEKIIIPLLDIGQSIPVLGFLPGLVLALIAIFPNSNLGLELSCIILIFTGQVWNMAFSFYASVKAVPVEFYELGSVIGLNWYSRFKKIELPYSAIGLAWNSMMSMAGGWFFLTVCEAFTLGDRKFKLPGLGSYMAVAIEQGDVAAMTMGVIAMCLVILLVDFAVWRPVIAWTKKFRLEGSQEEVEEIPFVTFLLKESNLIRWISTYFKKVRMEVKFPTHHPRGTEVYAPDIKVLPLLESLTLPLKAYRRRPRYLDKLIPQILTGIGILLLFWGGTRIWELIRPLNTAQWILILKSLFYTFLRVTAALVISSIWTIPAGIILGLSPKLSRAIQPVVQVAASFPAPMLYPLALMIMQKLGMGISIGSTFLMVLGVQWYVLFNVLAGATAISQELRDSLELIQVSRKTLWWALYLPSIFPALVTGWITAAGGAWNASIVAEFMESRGQTLIAPGIGSLISEAAKAEQYSLLAGCLLALILTVVGINRVFWHRLYHWVETRFRY